MGFLKRLLKTPDEDEDEGQDEFAAEENGLLMVPSLPRDEAEPATTEGGAAQADVPAAAGGAMAPPQAGPEPAEGALAQAVAGGLDPPDLPASLSATQIQPEPAPGQEPQPEQGPPDEAMDLFRAAAVRENLMPPILKEGVEDVSVTELLAEARSIRDCLSGGRSGTGEREQEAA